MQQITVRHVQFDHLETSLERTFCGSHEGIKHRLKLRSLERLRERVRFTETERTRGDRRPRERHGWTRPASGAARLAPSVRELNSRNSAVGFDTARQGT